jgi:hypothetical protein
MMDASQDLEICSCTTQMRLLVAAGFAMTLLTAILASDWWGALGSYDATIGYAGVVVFSLITNRLIWMLPAERGPVVIVTPYGIRDLRIGNEFLLWELIAEVSAQESRGHNTIVLTPTRALQQQFSCIRAAARADRILIRTED